MYPLRGFMLLFIKQKMGLSSRLGEERSTVNYPFLPMHLHFSSHKHTHTHPCVDESDLNEYAKITGAF